MNNSHRISAGVGPAFLDCDHEPGEATFSVLYADPDQPEGLAQPRLPFADDEEGWGDA